jgi:hypothetical protein
MIKKNLAYLSLFAFLISTLPIFFEMYRTAAFKTVPPDDYAPYLLALVGQGGEIPGAPFVYRILSVAVAIPFFYILPTYRFTNLTNIDPTYLKATQALCFTSYLALVLTSVVIYVIARKHYHATKAAAVIVTLLSFFLSCFLDRFMIVDTFGILIISLLILAIKNPLIFAPLILLSIGINEKITIVFGTLLFFRFLQAAIDKEHFAFGTQFISSTLAVISYFVVRLFLIKFPGNEQQITSDMYLNNLHNMLIDTLTLKGIYLNLLPVLILLFIVLLAVRYRQQTAFQVVDISGLVVLFLLAFIADVGLNVGRAVMYSFPLYLPAITAFIDDILEIKSQHPTVKTGKHVDCPDS